LSDGAILKTFSIEMWIL